MENKRINSIKRNAIFDAIMNSREHPTAEMVYETIRPSFPNVSLGTVYRNISVLLESGDVISIGNIDGKERYDARLDPHSHFVCKNCRRVLDIDIPISISDSTGEIKSFYGYTVDDYQLEFHGLCDKCLS